MEAAAGPGEQWKQPSDRAGISGDTAGNTEGTRYFGRRGGGASKGDASVCHLAGGFGEFSACNNKKGTGRYHPC